MTKLTQSQKWQRTIAWLRREFPTTHPVMVRSIRHGMNDLFGLTGLWDKQFYIKINRRKAFDARVETLLHEWAHARTWFGAEANEDHSAEWGMAYANIYRKFFEWSFGREKTDD